MINIASSKVSVRMLTPEQKVIQANEILYNQLSSKEVLLKKTILFLLSALYFFSNQAHPNIVENIRKAVYDVDLTKPMCESSVDHLLKPSCIQKYIHDSQIGTIKITAHESLLKDNSIKRYWFSCFPELIHQELIPLHNLFPDQNTEFNLITQLRDNLFAISSPNTIFIYDHNKGTLQPIADLESPIYFIVPINHGLQFATCSCDSKIKIWDVLTAQCIATFQAHNACIEKIFDTGNNTIMSFCKGELKATEWNHYGKILADFDFESEQEFDQFASTVPDAILSDRYCSLAASESSVALYDTQMQKVVCNFEGTTNSVKLLTNNLVTSCTGHGIQLYNITTNACIQSLNFHFCKVTNALVQTQCGNILFVLGGKLYLWEIYPTYLQELSLNQGALIMQLLRYKNDDLILVHPDWYKVFEVLPYKFKVTYLEEFMHKIEQLSLGKRNEIPARRSPSTKKICTQSEC